MACLQGFAGQFPAGIGDQRRPGIADQGDRRTVREFVEDLRPTFRPIMVMIRGDFGADVMSLQKSPRDSRVFG